MIVVLHVILGVLSLVSLTGACVAASFRFGRGLLLERFAVGSAVGVVLSGAALLVQDRTLLPRVCLSGLGYFSGMVALYIVLRSARRAHQG